MPKGTVEAGGILPPGPATGTVVGQELRPTTVFDERTKKEKEVEYLDIHVVPDGREDITLRPSYLWPFKEGSMGYNLLLRFGATTKQLKAGKSYDTEKFIPDGTKVAFSMVEQRRINPRTQEEQTFSVVVRDTLSPADDEEDDADEEE